MWIENQPIEELKTIAIGLRNGQIFTDRHLQGDASMLGMVFMPLAFGAFKDKSPEDLEEIGFIYEWLDKAGPRSVNGYPGFFSMKLVNREDAKKVFEMYEALQTKQDEALAAFEESR